MAILVDFSQVFISNFMSQIGIDYDDDQIDGLVRHMTLQTLLSYKKQFSQKYGELIVCVDGRNSWRKNRFIHYKANRKKRREEEKEKWDNLYQSLDKMVIELSDNFPYRIVKIDEAEADDIIAVLSKSLSKMGKNVMIISSDKDFVQLHDDNVKQFSPQKSEYIKVDNPSKFLKELVIRGDSVDGIPNIFSPEDILVTEGKRQKSIFAKKMVEWLDMPIKEICICEDKKLDQSDRDYITSRTEKRFKQNLMLIDFKYIPKNVKCAIIEKYNNEKDKKSKKVDYRYFVANSLPTLMDRSTEFNY